MCFHAICYLNTLHTVFAEASRPQASNLSFPLRSTVTLADWQWSGIWIRHIYIQHVEDFPQAVSLNKGSDVVKSREKRQRCT